MTLAQRPTIPAERYRERLDRAARLTAEHGFDGLLAGVGPDLEYLTGYRAMPLERLTMLVVIPDHRPVIVVPRLERSAAEAGLATDVTIITWGETNDPYLVVLGLFAGLAKGSGRLAVSDRLWASHLLRLQSVYRRRFEVASVVLRELRMRKDADEIELLRLAALAADRVIERIAQGRLVGRTEADVAREVRERLVAEGHNTAEFAIVASGPNSASPHHEASDRVIRAGEPIVLDIGGTLGGYASDVTRTLWVTGGDASSGPDQEFRRLYEVLHAAQEEGTGAVRPGIACERLDEIPRRIIEAAGHGQNFIHRTGHGIGLETHEEPYLVAGSSTPLDVGMAFSVEPGVYLEGRYGARIEDIVVCGPDGPIVLNEAPRELLVVDG